MLLIHLSVQMVAEQEERPRDATKISVSVFMFDGRALGSAVD